jgi:hypothetical protein
MTLLRRKKNPQGPKPLVWRGRRNCNVCTRWRPVSDFTVYQTRTGYEQIKGTCEVCKREKENARYQSLTPEQKRKKGIKANKQTLKRRNKALDYIERQRKLLDKQNDKIERLEKRVEAGRTRIIHTEGDRMDGTYVDIVPFRMWLLRRHREGGYDILELAEEIGQDDARVGRWLRGFEWNGAGRDPTPLRSIRLSTVDAVAVALEDPGLVARLYPLLIEE